PSPGPQSCVVGDPAFGIGAEPDLAAYRVGPLPRHQLRLDQRQRPPRRSQPFVGLGTGPHPAIRSWIPDLVPARGKPPHLAEPTCPRPVARPAPGRMGAQTGAGVGGGPRPAAMKAARAGSLIRTCRPTFTYSIRRSAIRRRMNRGLVLIRSAASSTVS